LRALEAHGIALDAARRMIYFRLAADADQFLTLGKLRALRKLWARVESACGLAHAPAFIAAETAWRMLSKRDAYVNMLRSTIAVFSAGLGGADTVSVLPFTMALGLPDRFARRVARNTQIVLLEESHLAKVADPAAGTGGLEDITDQLCAAAWTQFQEIESASGAWAALEQGDFQRKVAAVRSRRESAVARRQDALTGTSVFPDLGEIAPAVIDVPKVPAPGDRIEVRFEQLASFRLAQPFEELRDASDQMFVRTGARPKIFLANLGSVSDFTARATFAKNLFEAGGIAALTNDGFHDCDAMLAAFKRSGLRLACLCSTDAIYAREAPAAVQTLREAGAAVWLAGRPDALVSTLERAGIAGFVFTGCDALAELRKAHALVAD
jgi:methylmalonyl-CoA mutase